jgi:uncharacterized protein
MKVVIDTNCLLVALSPKSRYYKVFDAFLQSDFQLVVSDEIMLEYAEIFAAKANASVANYAVQAIVNHPCLIYQRVYFKWVLIIADYDDNKFTDAYIAANADYLITHDKHFNEVSRLKFPVVNILTLDAFIQLIN